MRVTFTIENRNFLENLSSTKARLDKAQNEISSGTKINQLSDGPYAAARASEMSAISSQNEEFIANNGELRSKFDFLDNTLQSLITSLDSARTLAAQALSGTTTPESREALAQGVDGVRKQVISISNAQYNGVFLFSGTKRPITSAFVDNAPGFTYNGNDEAIYQRVDRSTVVQTNITGQDLFVDPPALPDVLDNMKTAIQNNDVNAIHAELSNLETLSDRANTMAGTVGSRIQLLDQAQTRLRAQNLSLKTETSRLTDANLVESISDFNLATQAVNASLSSKAKVQELSLLDFLR